MEGRGRRERSWRWRGEGGDFLWCTLVLNACIWKKIKKVHGGVERVYVEKNLKEKVVKTRKQKEKIVEKIV